MARKGAYHKQMFQSILNGKQQTFELKQYFPFHKLQTRCLIRHQQTYIKQATFEVESNLPPVNHK